MTQVRLADLVEQARELDPDPRFTGLDDGGLVEELGRQASLVAASTCRYVELVAELVVRGVWVDHGARSPAQWLSYQVGEGYSTAAEHVRVGLCLRRLPSIREAFAAGRISYTKVRAVTRVAVRGEVERMLLDWCRWATGAEIERIVSGFRRSCRAEAGPAAPAARSWSRRWNGDGTTTFLLTMPDDEAEGFEARMERLIELEERSAAGEGEAVGEATSDGVGARDGDRDEGACSPELAAAGLAGDSSAEELAVEAAEHDAAPAATEAAAGPSRDDRRIEALNAALIAAVAAGGPDTTGLDRHTLVVEVTPASVPAEGSRPVPVRAGTGRLPSMSSSVLRRLACDASVAITTTGQDGHPLDMGRRQRHPTTLQRRALMARDRGCRFPGCDARRHLHAHHVVHWTDGGRTDLDNLVLLCGFHHRFVHDRDWQVLPAAAGTFRFAPPDGDPVPTAGQLPGVVAERSDGARNAPQGDFVRAHAAGEVVDPAPAGVAGTPRWDPVARRPTHWDPVALRPTHWDPRHFDLDTAILVIHQELDRLEAANQPVAA